MFYFVILFATIVAGLIPTIQAAVQTNQISAINVVLGTDIFLVIISFIYCLIEKADLKLTKKEVKYILPIGILIFITDYSLNSAYSLLPVGMVTMLHFLYPTIVCIVNMVLFKESKNIFKFMAIVLSLAGLYCLYGLDVNGDIKGVIIALISALSYASYLIIIGRVSIEKTSPSKMYFYAVVIETIISSVLTIIQGNKISMTIGQIGFCAISGFLLSTVGIVMNLCISKIGSSNSSLYGTLEPITSIVVSSIIYKYSLSIRSIIGCILIVLSLIPTAFTKFQKEEIK